MATILPDFSRFMANREIDLTRRREDDWAGRILRYGGKEDLKAAVRDRSTGLLTLRGLHEGAGLPHLLLALPEDPSLLFERDAPRAWLTPGGSDPLYALLYPCPTRKSRWDPPEDHPVFRALSQWSAPGHDGRPMGDGVLFRHYDRRLVVALKLSIEQAGSLLGNVRFPVVFAPQAEGCIVLLGLETYLIAIGWMDDPFEVVPEEHHVEEEPAGDDRPGVG
jgi:hypothetical protein